MPRKHGTRTWPITAVSLFAGVGGIDLALERAGACVVAAVEIDQPCRGVLARHFPQTTLFEDVTEVTGDQLRAAGFVPERGILAAGWPCTGNSVAGRREGLADPRSGLWVHIARLLAELRPAWFLGENVPGLYSVNKGRDIAIVRGDLAQCGYWWAERILDAQHFGLPQRRRRIFFAGCLGDQRGPVEVLFEPEGGGGHPAAGGQAGPCAAGASAGVAGDSRTVGTLGTTGPGGGWRLGADEAAAGQLVASTLQGRGHRVDAEGAAGGHLVAAEVAYALMARTARNDREQTWVTHALTSEGFDASEDGTGRGTPIVPISVPLMEVAAPLTSGTATGEGVNPPGRRLEDDTNLVATFSENQRGELLETPYSHQLTTGGGKPGGYPAVREGTAVRRLTPRECERLQGFPDDWTRWLADGTRQSDSARYRQCGNSVAVPVVEWIARRAVTYFGEVAP